AGRTRRPRYATVGPGRRTARDESCAAPSSWRTERDRFRVLGSFLPIVPVGSHGLDLAVLGRDGVREGRHRLVRRILGRGQGRARVPPVLPPFDPAADRHQQQDDVGCCQGRHGSPPVATGFPTVSRDGACAIAPVLPSFATGLRLRRLPLIAKVTAYVR